MIKGFKDAVTDPECPVYTNNYFPEDKDQILGGGSLFETGHAYFYIPPFPFSGEVETYNFLFNINMWNKTEKQGLVSPFRKITIINANDRFSQNSDKLNEFFKSKLEALNAEVIYNTELKSIDRENRKMELSGSNGNREEKEF